ARFAKDLGLPITAGDKERISDTEVRITIVGRQVNGFKRALVYDDEIATGGSILELGRLLLEQGVQEIWVACTHGVFTRGALERLGAIPQITRIVTTDTVTIPLEKRHPKLQVLSVAHIFGDAIRRNYLHQSIGDLFVFGEENK
ncbi:MAG: ribose-phosphate pyrophosphokinase, partial [Chloroflexota bacterium]